MAASSVVAFFLVVLAMIFVDIFCGDITNVQRNSNNAWQSQSGSEIGFNPNSKSTTPWPALGQRRPANSNNNRQTEWVQQNNIWVRNPQSNVNNKQVSTSFISRESGQNVGPQNQPKIQQNVGQNSDRTSTTTNRNTNYRHIMIQPWPSSSTSNPRQNIGVSRPTLGPITPVLPNNRITGPPSQNNFNNQEKANKPDEDETDFDGGNTQQGSAVADDELREFSEVLLTKDVNNAAKYVSVNYQGMTSSRSTNDEAPQPLLTIDRSVYDLPSVEKLSALYDNYILEAKQNEVYTAQEKIEENNLLDTVLSTPVMQHTRNFLISKGKIGKDPKQFKDTLRLIWFNMYSRGGGRIGSSGFEHVFLAELKNNQVSGLHNWLYFSKEESKNEANYLGYMKKISLGDKGAILKYHFTFQDVDKPVGSMFIGTSPELEMALYSACFLLRADRICPLKMNGSRFIIRTYTYRYRGKNMIGSAFPEI